MTLTNIYPHDPQTYAIIGAAIEVQRVMGCGFLEQAYRLPLRIEFTARDIPSRVNVPFRINYKGIDTGVTYRADFVCFDETGLASVSSVSSVVITHRVAKA
jgi:GxxExxY protein